MRVFRDAPALDGPAYRFMRQYRLARARLLTHYTIDDRHVRMFYTGCSAISRPADYNWPLTRRRLLDDVREVRRKMRQPDVAETAQASD